MRDNCQHKARCGKTGHYWEAGRLLRCPCLEIERSRNKLREIYDQNPNTGTALKAHLEENLLITGPLASVRRHVSGAILSLQRPKRYVVLDAYRLLEIFLEKDTEFETQRPTTEVDMLVLLLGFGDPRNRYVPELVIQALTRRALLQLPTWIVSNLTIEQIQQKYTIELATLLRSYKPVTTK